MMVDGELAIAQATALVAGESDPIANAANLSALVVATFDRVNWAGFYFVRGAELVLGPFQGKSACTRIARGRGVCGAAWARVQTLVVPDVRAFADHIACDAASASEVVVPIVRDGNVIAVLDVDSPVPDRFSPGDVATLEGIAAVYARASSAR